MSFHTSNNIFTSNSNSLENYQNNEDFEIEIIQDDIDLSNIDYFDSDDEYESPGNYMESTPLKSNLNKIRFSECSMDCDYEAEDSIKFEFTERSDVENDKYINGVNVSQLSINASLSRFAATYPSQCKSHSLPVCSSQY